MRNLIKLFCGLPFLFALSLPAFGAPKSQTRYCAAKLAAESLETAADMINSQGVANSFVNRETFLTPALKKFAELSPEVQNRLGSKRVEAVLTSNQLPFMRIKLYDLIFSLSPSSTVNDLNKKLKKMLKLRVPKRQVTDRIQGLQSPEGTRLLRALGYLELQETQELFYGSNPLQPSRESLLGMYLAEANAASVIRTFPRGATAEEGQGEARLAAGLDAASRPLFLKYFDFPEIMFHYHTPQQGTLLMYFNGKKISYAGENVEDFSPTTFHTLNMILPTILLGSDEANRIMNYFILGQSQNELAKTPWQFNYCVRGGYSSCTHWIGEIPSGSRRSGALTFPGRVDDHADNDVPVATRRGKIRGRMRIPHETLEYLNDGLSNSVTNSHPALNLQENSGRMLVDTVWTYPGHEHFADALGAKDAKERGEFANPGYVAHALMGQVSPTRVPLVFKVVAEASSKLQPDFDLQTQPF